jgi:hypothetical protein
MIQQQNRASRASLRNSRLPESGKRRMTNSLARRERPRQTQTAVAQSACSFVLAQLAADSAVSLPARWTTPFYAALAICPEARGQTPAVCRTDQRVVGFGQRCVRAAPNAHASTPVLLDVLYWHLAYELQFATRVPVLAVLPTARKQRMPSTASAHIEFELAFAQIAIALGQSWPDQATAAAIDAASR